MRSRAAGHGAGAHHDFARRLQEALGGIPEAALRGTAFRLLGREAATVLGTRDVLVVAEECHGHGRLLVPAVAGPAATADAVLAAFGEVRTHAVHARPVQVRLAVARDPAAPAAREYVVVPLRCPPPGWAAMVAPVPLERRPGAAVLAVLEELAEITAEQLGQAQARLGLRHSAEHDALTGVLNRRTLDALLAAAFAGAGQRLAVLLIDLDGLGQVNDSHGNACGDHCLREMAACLRAELRPADTLGRQAGGTFLVILPGQDEAAARVLAERLRRTVEHTPVVWRGALLALTASIGLAARRRADGDAAALMERAGSALARAKREGRNSVRSMAME